LEVESIITELAYDSINQTSLSQLMKVCLTFNGRPSSKPIACIASQNAQKYVNWLFALENREHSASCLKLPVPHNKEPLYQQNYYASLESDS
jgi:hypothetical protein